MAGVRRNAQPTGHASVVPAACRSQLYSHRLRVEWRGAKLGTRPACQKLDDIDPAFTLN